MEYRAWLLGHVAEILRLPGFIDASVLEVEEMAATEHDTDQRLCVHYRLRDRAALQDYLAVHAPRLRRDGVNRFADLAHIHRRVLIPSA